jgi:hypothetical protein
MKSADNRDRRRRQDTTDDLPNRPRLRRPEPPESLPRPWDDAADENLRVFARGVVDLAIRIRARKRELARLSGMEPNATGYAESEPTGTEGRLRPL